eukprot:1140553-Pelagomonas_calceolata.AAC.2
MTLSVVSAWPAASKTFLSERHSGGFYKSMMAAAGQASRAKRAAAEQGLDQDLPGCSRDQQAEAAGDKAAAEVLAAGGDEHAAKEARKAAMQRIIDAYHAGAAAAAAAAAEGAVSMRQRRCAGRLSQLAAATAAEAASLCYASLACMYISSS